MITTIVADVSAMNNEVGELFKDSSKNEDSDTGSASYSYKKGNVDSFDKHSMIAKNVMKIFDRKLGTFVVRAPERLSRAAILTEILKLTIKSFEECVRTCTFGKNGFQQLQLDTHFLRVTWSNVTDDEMYVVLMR